MSDVFLSYASESWGRASELALALEARGWSVWWDRHIPVGSSFAGVIEKELAHARCVVVAWTRDACTSDWVRDEAEAARRRGVLIPVLLDPVEPPIGFRSIQAASLAGWKGDPAAAELGPLVQSIAQVLGSPPLPPPPPRRAEKPHADSRAQRNRDHMLAQVQRFWIEGVLERSIHDVAKIGLEIKMKPDAVENPWDSIFQQPDRLPEPVAPGTPPGNAFDSAGGALLVLGAPGAGKTTFLLELARDLIGRATRDPSYPIPAVFNLSSWATRRQPLDEWLIREMRDRYNVPEKIGKAWLAKDALLPLLDGLDEVAADHRDACVDALNDFHRRFPLTQLAVCSRTEEYNALASRLCFPAAIMLQPLTRAQIGEYLERGGEALAGVRRALSDDETVWELLDTPLMLSIVALTYANRPAGELESHGSPEERRDALFCAYVQAMFERRSKSARYRREKMVHWLSCLGALMARSGQSLFYIESLQPNALARRVLRSMVPALAAVLVGIAVGLPLALMSASGGTISGISVFGFAWILSLGVRPIKPVELLGWKWAGMGRGLLESLLASFGVFFLLSPLGSMILDWFDRGVLGWPSFHFGASLFLAVTFGLLGGVPRGVFCAVQVGELRERRVPNEGIRRSVWNALMSGALVALVASVFVTWAIGDYNRLLSTLRHSTIQSGTRIAVALGLSSSIAAGMLYGGFAALEHGILRLLLWKTGAAPLNYPAFLNHATDRILLHRTGGGYVFVHRLLLEHFARRANGSPVG
jgi:hypothetical protein